MAASSMRLSFGCTVRSVLAGSVVGPTRTMYAPVPCAASSSASTLLLWLVLVFCSSLPAANKRHWPGAPNSLAHPAPSIVWSWEEAGAALATSLLWQAPTLFQPCRWAAGNTGSCRAHAS
eukprot:356365-Chlamydomonas_euryale.AAC.9